MRFFSFTDFIWSHFVPVFLKIFLFVCRNQIKLYIKREHELSCLHKEFSSPRFQVVSQVPELLLPLGPWTHHPRGVWTSSSPLMRSMGRGSEPWHRRTQLVSLQSTSTTSTSPAPPAASSRTGAGSAARARQRVPEDGGREADEWLRLPGEKQHPVSERWAHTTEPGRAGPNHWN